MRITTYALPFSLVLLAACPAGDDTDTETTSSMTSAASTTDASAESSSSTASSVGTDTGTSSGSEGTTTGSSGADSTTGSGMEVCATCTAMEICFASIIDGPTEYSCRPAPEECVEDFTCECVTPIECPKALQSCEYEGGVMIVECVEG